MSNRLNSEQLRFLRYSIDNFGLLNTKTLVKVDLNEKIKSQDFLSAHIRKLMLEQLNLKDIDLNLTTED